MQMPPVFIRTWRGWELMVQRHRDGKEKGRVQALVCRRGKLRMDPFIFAVMNVYSEKAVSWQKWELFPSRRSVH